MSKRRPDLVKPIAAAMLVIASCTVVPTRSGPEGERVSFNRDVRPLLSDHCFHCHGPDARNRKAHLRLDRPDGDEGAYRRRRGRAAIRPGDPEESRVFGLVSAGKMPPSDSHKQPLSPAEVDILRRWIEQGAKFERHWAFVSPRHHTAPNVKHPRFSKRRIDRFVMRRLESAGLAPRPRADKRALIRRATFDLTGLPPSRAEIRSFLADESPKAYQHLIDRLLNRPQYGEHMARYWLDLVRFADTNGVHHDHYREMSLYRDWVIRAFNENLPYDEFAKWQIAGDQYDSLSDDPLIASGFNRLHMIIDVGTALPEESLARNVIDRVTAYGTAFLGLTVGCAVCHDHKYDPLTQKDFYQLYAFFNNLDGAPETGGRRGTDFRRGLQQPYKSFATTGQRGRLAHMGEQIDEAAALLACWRYERDQADAEEKKALTEEVKKREQKHRELVKQRDDLLCSIPAAMVMRERKEPRKAHILIRGQYDDPGEEVRRDTPAFLPRLRPKVPGRPTRKDLADWTVSPENPLTARVAVNRFWRQFFGRGLVETAADFGTQGEWPSHPELLDDLAVSFRESGWDVKGLVRQIVLSETYRQAATASPDAFVTDPDNRLLARGPRVRMDAEMIRDQVLATSGLLQSKMYGKSVKPPQPPGIWKAVTLPSSYPRVYKADVGDAIHRRSVYTFWKRGMPPPQMTILNAPTREYCVARRERTNTPLQALLLLNESEWLGAARHLARGVLQAQNTAEKAARVLYETITSQLPDAVELAVMIRLGRDLESAYGLSPELADEMCDGLVLGEHESPARISAWTMVASSIYNLDVAKAR